MICSKAESHTKRSRTLNRRALLIRPAPAQRGGRREHRAGLGQRKEGRAPKLAPSCATTGVGPQWWRSTAALRTEGWCLMPGCSPDLFPGRAQLQSRHSLPQHASEGSFPAPQPPGLLLLPLSLACLCFLQQLRATGHRAGSLKRGCVGSWGLSSYYHSWTGGSHAGAVREKERNQSKGRARERSPGYSPTPRGPSHY